jgi:hypothetical protein
MPKTQKYIVKNKPLPIAQDLEALKATGIALAKQYSGDIWTDYNDHDPGVTVLENLCYAITEMSYKVDFDFEKLFFASNGQDIELEVYFLLHKHEVSYSSPVTELDYRKLLLDHFGGEDVKNIWVLAKGEEKGEKGYTIWVHAQKKDIATKIKTLYNQKRNFGEKDLEVKVLEYVGIQDYFVIDKDKKNQLSKQSFVEGVAQFIYDIKVFIEPGIRYARSIKNLDLTVEEKAQIFQGPHPEKKFIHPAYLAATEWDRMKGEIDLKEFINEHNEERWNGLIKLKDGKETTIKRIDEAKEAVTVFNEEEFYKDKEDIKKAYLSKSIPPLLNGELEWETYQPQPNNLRESLTKYHSVQETFPPNYRLGQKDLSHLNENGKTQIKNLQAYLLLFESLLVDYLVKIISFPELLKINRDPSTNGDDIAEKKFYEILTTIPGASGLPEKVKDVFKQYSFDLDQQIKLREYALARYGETFDTDLLQRAWEKESDDLEFKKAWLKQLGQLINCFTNYCESRHNSYDILDPKSDFPLSQKLSILLNQEYNPKAPNVYIVEGNLIEYRTENPFQVAVVIDLKEDKDITVKREQAIKDLIKKELPFYLDCSFFFLTDKDQGVKHVDDLFKTNKVNTLNRDAFKIAFETWREVKSTEERNRLPRQDTQG